LVFEVKICEQGEDPPADRLTRAAALLARRIVRGSDVVGLLSDCSFGIVANAAGDGAQALAQSLATELGGLAFQHEGEHIPVEVCYGVACLDGPKTARELLEEARAALQLRVSVPGIQGHS
jgi:GGDEF domain-containing protein